MRTCWLVALMVSAPVAGCRELKSTEGGGPATAPASQQSASGPSAGQPSTSAPAGGGSVDVRLKPETLDTLLAYPAEQREILLVRATSTRFVAVGSRSERVYHEAEVVESGLGNVHERVSLNCYTKNETPALEEGKLYLVAAFGQGGGQWMLFERVAVGEGESAVALKQATAALADRAQEQGGP